MRFAALRALLGDVHGTMAIETAIVAPLLATMAFGAFDVSMMVSHEQKLQSAANEATEIVLAAANGSGIQSNDLKTLLESSLGLTDSQLQLDPEYRCGTGDISTSMPTCATGTPVYTYVKLTITDTYSPSWTNFGIGSDVFFNIVRTVQTS